MNRRSHAVTLFRFSFLPPLRHNVMRRLSASAARLPVRFSFHCSIFLSYCIAAHANNLSQASIMSKSCVRARELKPNWLLSPVAATDHADRIRIATLELDSDS